MANRIDIMKEIAIERSRQFDLGYTKEHDDSHNSWDFASYISRQLIRLYSNNDPRSRFIKVAALAIAAIEALDRRSNK